MNPGCKPGIDAKKKIPGEGFKRAGPPLIKVVTDGVAELFGTEFGIGK